MKKKESTKKRFFEGSALGSALRMTKRKGLAAIVISLLFALVLSACSVAAIDSNKPIEGSVDVTSETKEATLSYSTSNLVLTNTYNFAYTGAQQTLSGGFRAGYVYKLEVWGAQGGTGGGSSYAGTAGQGGYSMGYYNATTAVANVYVFVGQQGRPTAGGTAYNGGGGASTSGGGSGGGGTDIRTTANAYANRIIVAGGGGGAGGANSASCTGTGNGGAGGGSTGAKGANVNGWTDSTLKVSAVGAGGSGGTASSGGAGGASGTGVTAGNAGSLGVGGNAGSWGGGGGGGYYGGGSNSTAYHAFGGGGGGSGYIGGVDSLSNSAAVNQQGGWTGNGKAVITEYALFTLKSPSYLNKARLTSFTIPKLDVANEATSTTTALTFNNTTNLYLDNAGTTAASDYFTVTGTADELTVTPKVSIESTTFYAYMKSASGALVYAPITISTKNDLMIMKS